MSALPIFALETAQNMSPPCPQQAYHMYHVLTLRQFRLARCPQ